MSKNKTLNDLSDFLNQNPQQIVFKNPSSKDDYLRSEPNSLVDVPQIKEDKNTFNLLSANASAISAQVTPGSTVINMSSSLISTI